MFLVSGLSLVLSRENSSFSTVLCGTTFSSFLRCTRQGDVMTNFHCQHIEKEEATTEEFLPSDWSMGMCGGVFLTAN